MPAPMLKGFADKHGISMDKMEKAWNDAKKKVKDQYPDVSEDSDKFYQLTMGIAKKMAGIKESFIDLVDEELSSLTSIIEAEMDKKKKKGDEEDTEDETDMSDDEAAEGEADGEEEMSDGEKKKEKKDMESKDTKVKEGSCGTKKKANESVVNEENWIQDTGIEKNKGDLRAYFGKKEGETISAKELDGLISKLQSKAEGDKTLSDSDSKLLKQALLAKKLKSYS